MGISRRHGILKKVKTLLKGKPVDLPSTIKGQELREAMNIPQNRMLIVRPGKGGSVRRITPQESVEVQPGDEFDDMPIGRWGA